MSERTPSTVTIRHAWAKANPFPLTTDVEERYAEFDRWLAAHDAAKRAEWEAEQGEPEWEYGIGAEYEDNPNRFWRDDEYDITTELFEALGYLDDAKSGGTFDNAIVIRRRAKDAWHRLPVPVRVSNSPVHDSDTNESEG